MHGHHCCLTTGKEGRKLRTKVAKVAVKVEQEDVEEEELEMVRPADSHVSFNSIRCVYG